MTAANTRRPGISVIGQVTVSDGEIRIHGWTLGVCFTQCQCHLHPANGLLYVSENSDPPLLGLKSFAPSGCDCCAPWSAEELGDIVDTLRELQAA